MSKYKYYVLLLLLLSILNINFVISKSYPLLGKIIIIDPGHGGADTGAFYFNNYESNLNLIISLKLKKQFEQKGAYVVLTRDGNYDLSSPNSFRRKKSDFDNRILLINNINPDCVLSIHMNASSNNNWSGMQIFYSKNKKLSKMIYKEVKPKRGLKKIDKIYFLDHIKYPVSLIEYGFISNYNDLKLLGSKKYVLSTNEKIINGVINYLND